MRKTKGFMPMKRLLWCIVSAAVLFSCRKAQTQLPANRRADTELSALDLAQVNREMIRREDSVLTAFVVRSGLQLTKTDSGLWYRLDRTTDGGMKLRHNDVCTVSYRLALCDGTPLDSVDGRRLTVGKREVVAGLDEVLLLMKPGERATCLLPWHLAYGMPGDGRRVPPYTSLLCTVEVQVAEQIGNAPLTDY